MELVRKKLREDGGGKGIEEGWKTASFLATGTHGDERYLLAGIYCTGPKPFNAISRTLNLILSPPQFSGLLCSSLAPCEPRAALKAVAQGLHLLLPHPTLLAR